MLRTILFFDKQVVTRSDVFERDSAKRIDTAPQKEKDDE